MVPRRLVLRELLAEEQYLRVSQVQDEAEDEVEEHGVLLLLARVLEQRHQVGLQHLDLAQPAAHLMIVIIPPELRETKDNYSGNFFLVREMQLYLVLQEF